MLSTSSTRREALLVIAVLLALGALKLWVVGHAGVLAPADWPRGTLRMWLDRVVATVSSRELNKEAREALTAGYYEGLLNEGRRLSSMNLLVTDKRRVNFELRDEPDRRETHDFLYYELIPNADVPDYPDHRARYRRKVNSAGFSDQDYPLERTPGLRRLVLLGDSIARGQGAPFGRAFEGLLEEQLNARDVGGEIKGYEILNFAVGSYNLTQQLGMATMRAQAYQPDVYVYALSTLSV
jgi:hypothetical protein